MTHHVRLLALRYFVAAGLASSSASAQDLERPVIIVLVYNHAAVGPDTLTRAEAQAAVIFDQIGVDIIWVDPSADSRYSAINPTSNSLGTFTVQMVVRAHATGSGPAVHGESEMGMALGGGTATGGVARLFYDRVTTVAHERQRNVSDVLGWAMAHEMGHLVLPYPSHSTTGIMSAVWNGDAFRHATDGALLFTPSQAALIRSRCRMAN